MSRYNRYKEEKNLLMYVVLFVLATVCTILAIVYWSDIKAFFRGDEPKTEQVGGVDEKPDDEKGGSSSTEKVEVSEVKYFEFERSFLRYTTRESSTRKDITQISFEYAVPDEIAYDVMTSDNKSFGWHAGYYADYHAYASKGMTASDFIVEEYKKGNIDISAESEKGLCPERLLGADGVYWNVMRMTINVSYDSLNTRLIVFPYIVEQNGDNVLFHAPSFSGLDYTNWAVSPSMSYLASAYLNQYDRLQVYCDPEMRAAVKEVEDKAIAQAQGVAETDYLADTEYNLTLNTSETLTLAVGETKHLDVWVTPNVDVQILYIGDFDMLYLDDYKITYDGYVTGLKTGTYECVVLVSGVRATYTINVTE